MKGKFMKKIANIIILISSTCLLFSCARKVTSKEAIEVASNLKLSDLNIKEGKRVIKYNEISANGEKALGQVSLLSSQGITVNTSQETIFSNGPYDAFFINADYIKLLGDENVSYTLDGTALILEATNKIDQEPGQIENIKYNAYIEYRSDGLMKKEIKTTTTTFADNDALIIKTTTTFTWTLY